jgi:hypothetical protein
MDRPSPANNFQARHVRLLLSSFRRFVGRPLIDEAPSASNKTAAQVGEKARLLRAMGSSRRSA